MKVLREALAAGRRAAPALVFVAGCCGSPSAPRADPLCTVPPNHHYARALRWYMADLKASFPESDNYADDSALTEANYAAVLSGLVNNVGINGVRLPIIPSYRTPAFYPRLYAQIVAYARSLGLAIYASPLSFGSEPYEGWSDERYAAWVSDYVTAFRPNFVSPFNEAGFTEERMKGIMGALRRRMASRPVLIGPDKRTVFNSIVELRAPDTAAATFDVVGIHNTGGDDTATAENWSRAVAASPGGRPVWSTENPAYWSVGQRVDLPGIIGAVASGVKGLVIWKAKPSLVDDAGQATSKACKLAPHIIAPS